MAEVSVRKREIKHKVLIIGKMRTLKKIPKNTVRIDFQFRIIFMENRTKFTILSKNFEF